MPTAEDLLPPTVPTRSRLYSLEPIGIGTLDVESLESYTARLAWLHGVTPGLLMTREIASVVALGPRQKTGGQLSLFDPQTITGTGASAERWINALELLTLRSDLSYLTLRPWRDVLPSAGLNRRSKVWCPHCFEEDVEPYDRLLWRIAVVAACPKHRVLLTEACPHCSSKLPLRGYTAVPGFCVRCSRSLAQPRASELSAVSDDDSSARAFRNAAEVGALLAAADQHNIPSVDRIFTALPELRRRCKLQGVDLNWRYHKRKRRCDANGLLCAWENQRMSLESLLNFCENAGVSLRDLLTVPLEALKPCPKQLPSRKKPQPVLVGPEVFLPKLRRIVESNEDPPPPLVSVSRTLNVRLARLHEFAPELCRTILERYRNHVRSRSRERSQRIRDEVCRVATELKNAGGPITNGFVAKRLAQPGTMRCPAAREALRNFIAQNAS